MNEQSSLSTRKAGKGHQEDAHVEATQAEIRAISGGQGEAVAHEEWRAIAGYEGLYEVSNMGNVRSLDRVDCRGQRVLGRVLNPWLSTTGYYRVHLSKNGSVTQVGVHQLVARAFTGGLGPQVNHISGIKTDNRALNLEWASDRENKHHAWRMGLYTRHAGARASKAKLSQEDVDNIRCRCANGESQRGVARSMGLSSGHVNNIVKRRYWA